jgi:ABC-type dipeptide/oligopeptide/nickel transport system permease subunit
MWVQGVSRPGVPEHPLGTDRFGRDILSRLIYGGRTAFFLALTAVPLAALIGT